MEQITRSLSNVCNEASVIFTKRSQCPSKIEESDLQILEKLVVLMYDRSSSVASVNEARLALLARKLRSYDLIPPTQGALKEHANRAAYEAGRIWSQVIVRQPEPQCPSAWGWFKEDDSWKLFWTALAPIAKSCQELTECKTQYSGSKCFRFGLSCTPLCSCFCQT